MKMVIHKYNSVIMNFQVTEGYYSSVSKTVYNLNCATFVIATSLSLVHLLHASILRIQCTQHTALLTLVVPFMHTISLSNAGPVMCHVMYTVASIMSVFIFLAY